MKVGDDGVENFVWPVGFDEVQSVRDFSVYNLVETLRKGLDNEAAGAEELAILSPYYVTEIMTLYQAFAYRSRTGAKRHEVDLPGNMPTWDAVLADREPPVPAVFEQLMNSFQPKGLSELLSKPAQMLAKLKKKKKTQKAPVAERLLAPNPYADISLKRIHKSRLGRAALQESIVSTRRGNILSAHAASVDKTVVLGAHKFWFSYISRSQVDNRMAHCLDESLEKELLDVVRQAFKAGSVEMPEHLERYYASLLRIGAAIVSIHIERLLKKQWKLPKELWTGTGGNIWDRILRFTVREIGGVVCGHSHAGGSEHVINPYIAFNEFPGVDSYAVYNDLQQNLTIRHADQAVLFEDALPEVIVPRVLEERKAGKTTMPPPRSTQRKIRKVMYVGTSIFAKDRLNLYPAVPDIVAVDWQSRLFSNLRKWGYDIIHKPHPESFLPPPSAFQDTWGAHRESRIFEECVADADLLIFDTQSTSTFPVAIYSGVPMIFVDLGRFAWEPEAFKLLKQRCSVVSAGFGDDNRVKIVWDDLLQGILDAPAKAGHRGLADRYFG